MRGTVLGADQKAGRDHVTCEPANYRLICMTRGAGNWQVEMRAGGFWSVGEIRNDFDAAVASAREKFAADHPSICKQRSRPAPVAAPSTDLSDLFI